MDLFLDIETRYNSENYTLSDLSIVEYCRDKRFKIFGLAFAFDDGEIAWTHDIDTFIKQVQWDQVDVVSHNIKFDMFALKALYNIAPRSYVDTKGMSKAILGKAIKSHHLAELATYFKLQSKGTMKTDGLEVLTPEQEAELAEYCKHDVWLCREIFKKLESGFPDSQWPILSQTIEMFVSPKLELDVSLLEKCHTKEVKRRETIFKEIGIEKAEFASNKKFPELLASKGYQVPTKKSPRTGNDIPALALGDPEFLRMLKSTDPALRTLCEARRAAKSTLLETRSQKLAAIGRTGLWPFDVEFSGAEQTHRFSGGSGAGGNPQNFTKDSDLREAVRAPKGYKVVVGDFAAIEARLVAYLAKEKGLTNVFEANGDPYCDFASSFFGRKITKEDKDERKFGKTCILGLGYNMGAAKFQKKVYTDIGQTITDEVAKRAVSLYRNRYTKITALWEWLDRRIGTMIGEPFKEAYDDLPVVIDRGGVVLPGGLWLRYTNLRQQTVENGYRKGDQEWVYDIYDKGQLITRSLYGGKLLENISQALAGELCKAAMQKLKRGVVGQVHDELLMVVKEEEVEEAADAMYQAMTTSPDWMPNLCLDANIYIKNNWRECK